MATERTTGADYFFPEGLVDENGALNRRVLGDNWLVSVMRPWLQVIRPMTCIHGRAIGANHFPRTARWTNNRVLNHRALEEKWLVSVVRSVASKATVDAGHPIHDQRRWQAAVWLNFISFNV